MTPQTNQLGLTLHNHTTCYAMKGVGMKRVVCILGITSLTLIGCNVNAPVSVNDHQNQILVAEDYPSPVPYNNAYEIISQSKRGGAPNDIAIDDTYLYLNYGTHVDQMQISTETVVSTKWTAVDHIDYVSGFGVIGVSNTTRSVYINIMGSNLSCPLPGELDRVYAVSGRVIDGQLRLIFTIPGKYYGTRLYECKYYGGRFNRIGETTANVQQGYYNRSDITTEGTNLIDLSSYYYPSFTKRAGFSLTPTYETLPSGYNCHGYYSSITSTYEIANPDKIEWGNSGCYCLIDYPYYVDIIFIPNMVF